MRSEVPVTNDGLDAGSRRWDGIRSDGVCAPAADAAEAILCRLPAGRPPLWTATRRHWTRDAEYEKVICPGASVYLKIDIGFIWESYIELPIVFAPKSHGRSIFTTSLITVERPCIAIKLRHKLASSRHHDMWQYMGIKFPYVLPILSFKQSRALKATERCVLLVLFTKLRKG